MQGRGEAGTRIGRGREKRRGREGRGRERGGGEKEGGFYFLWLFPDPHYISIVLNLVNVLQYKFNKLLFIN